MGWLVDMLIVFCLLIIAYQDFRERLISWQTLPVLLFLFVIKNLGKQSVEETAMSFIINSVFITIQLLVLSLYYTYKAKKWVNITREYLGWGDVLFFLVLAAMFSPAVFIVFYLVCLLVSIFGFLVWKQIKKGSSNEIPLAGIFAIPTIIYVVLSNWYSLDHYFQNLV